MCCDVLTKNIGRQVVVAICDSTLLVHTIQRVYSTKLHGYMFQHTFRRGGFDLAAFLSARECNAS
jgi:hypothetical protein